MKVEGIWRRGKWLNEHVPALHRSAVYFINYKTSSVAEVHARTVMHRILAIAYVRVLYKVMRIRTIIIAHRSAIITERQPRLQI